MNVLLFIVTSKIKLLQINDHIWLLLWMKKTSRELHRLVTNIVRHHGLENWLDNDGDKEGEGESGVRNDDTIRRKERVRERN